MTLWNIKRVARETDTPLSSLRSRRGNTLWLWRLARNVSESKRPAWRWRADEVMEAFAARPRHAMSRQPLPLTDQTSTPAPMEPPRLWRVEPEPESKASKPSLTEAEIADARARLLGQQPLKTRKPLR